MPSAMMMIGAIAIFGIAAEDQDVRLDNPGQARAKAERKANRSTGERADDIAEHDLPEGDRGIGPYLAPAISSNRYRRISLGCPMKRGSNANRAPSSQAADDDDRGKKGVNHSHPPVSRSDLFAEQQPLQVPMQLGKPVTVGHRENVTRSRQRHGDHV